MVVPLVVQAAPTAAQTELAECREAATLWELAARQGLEAPRQLVARSGPAAPLQPTAGQGPEAPREAALPQHSLEHRKPAVPSEAAARPQPRLVAPRRLAVARRPAGVKQAAVPTPAARSQPLAQLPMAAASQLAGQLQPADPPEESACLVLALAGLRVAAWPRVERRHPQPAAQQPRLPRPRQAAAVPVASPTARREVTPPSRCSRCSCWESVLGKRDSSPLVRQRCGWRRAAAGTACLDL